MNKISKYFALLIIAIAAISCQKDDEITLTDDSLYPRIFGTWPEPDTSAGEVLGSFNGQTNLDFTIEVQYTPYELCEAIWYLDDVEYCRGNVFSYYSTSPITHTIKIVVTTPDYQTYREAYLKVTNPI